MVKLRLKELRGKKSQQEVANDLGVIRGSYSRYETGRAMPFPVLFKVADYYNVSLDYLLGRDRDMSIVSLNSLALPEQNVVKMYSLLNGHHQLRAYGFAVGVISGSGYDVTEYIKGDDLE